MSAEAVWILAERLSREHIAQLYSSETVLIESLHLFIAHGLSGGESVILVTCSCSVWMRMPSTSPASNTVADSF